MPRTTATPTTPEVTFPGTDFEGKTVAQVKNALYAKALQDLRNQHDDEFFEIIDRLYSAYGLRYKRRLTDAQKDEQKARAILAANPGLLAKIVAEVAPAEIGEIAPTE